MKWSIPWTIPSNTVRYKNSQVIILPLTLKIWRTPDQSVVHCQGHRSCRGQRSFYIGLTYIACIRLSNLVERIIKQSVVQPLLVKDHAGISWGQPKVILLKNAIKFSWKNLCSEPTCGAYLGSKVMQGSRRKYLLCLIDYQIWSEELLSSLSHYWGQRLWVQQESAKDHFA